MASKDKAASKDKGDKGAAKDNKSAPPQGKVAPKEKKVPKDKSAAKVAVGETKAGGPARLQTFYREKVVPDLMSKLACKTVMQVPRLQKITLNMGVSEAVADKKVMDHAVGDLTKIS